MYIVHAKTGKSHEIKIEPIRKGDYKLVTKSKFWFDWKKEKDFLVFKLKLKQKDEILGLISLDIFESESRIEIRLLAVSKENRGANKQYERITGNLIAFAGKEAVKRFGEMACISLVPKTQLIEHYINSYSMIPAGKSLFVDGIELIQLIHKYEKQRQE